MEKAAERRKSRKALHKNVEIPATVVGGYFQVLSTRHVLRSALIPPTAVGGYFKWFLREGLERSTHCRGWDLEIVLSSFQ